MVQKKVTEAFPRRRAASRVPEKRKPVKSKELHSSDEDFEQEGPRRNKVDENSLESFRKALDTSSPENLPGRDAQIFEVSDFLTTHLTQKKPGSLYISGAPGTGKTAVVQYVLDRTTGSGAVSKFYQIYINCMCKTSATDIYGLILEKLQSKGKRQAGTLKEKVEARLFSKSKSAYMIVIILDEMDQILKGSNEVLYSLFEWARSPDSKLILIGIANALDLTVRHLPFLHLDSSPVKQPKNAVVQSQCKTLSFPPYKRDDIERIIQERMEQVGQNIFAQTAIKFVAAKVAASTGDARKALHACKEAMVTVEKQEQREALKAAEENGLCCSTLSPKKICIRNDQIGILAVSKAIQTKKDDGPLPLQQITILAGLLKASREAPHTKDPLANGTDKPIPMAVLYRHYRKICSLKGLSWIEESELPLVCDVLQDRSLLSVVNNGSSGKKLSIGKAKFGSPSSQNNKVGVLFDSRLVEGLVFQGDLKTLFG